MGDTGAAASRVQRSGRIVLVDEEREEEEESLLLDCVRLVVLLLPTRGDLLAA